jgi:4,5-dihydroxyphthalate decarboxylase
VAALHLTLACGDYDRTRALWDGRVAVEGVDLTYLRLEPEETFWRMLRHREFDAAEMSLAMYAIGKAQGASSFVAIPVFPSRFFRHSSIYVNVNSGVEQPTDLIGKRVGVPEYQITAAVWVRGILEREYGVRPTQMTWVTGGQERPDREAKMPLQPLPEVRVERAPAGSTLNEMLIRGEIAALVAARPPTSFLAGDDRLRRLFPDYRTVEKDYFRRTGIFPIMHTVVIKQEIVAAQPWLAQSLTKAFTEAKALCLGSITNMTALRTMLPWMTADVDEMLELMGDDPWPYGVEPNRVTIQTLLDDLVAQGLMEHLLEVDDLFAPSTLSAYRL